MKDKWSAVFLPQSSAPGEIICWAGQLAVTVLALWWKLSGRPHHKQAYPTKERDRHLGDLLQKLRLWKLKALQMANATLKAKRNTCWGQVGPQLYFSWTVSMELSNLTQIHTHTHTDARMHKDSIVRRQRHREAGEISLVMRKAAMIGQKECNE